ncbi:hypothetical protein SAMN06265222_11076 [Neorhodopirellula lusitana]|uniref:Tetratricopeptide repeat protein n=1 Tax=Neorhodopirellula lusitana TaxID=445327 RepID=A0ABY1QBY2_9BACT|nr:tetratricopeptide repeat protein [Neorhodopirellula lusitana]SMP66980.1 hypothetical protein SAMN06265222_11076 [Neorhodopirellula lusitana]
MSVRFRSLTKWFVPISGTLVAIFAINGQLNTINENLANATTAFFGRWDVLVVCLLAAAPLAMLLTARTGPPANKHSNDAAPRSATRAPDSRPTRNGASEIVSYPESTERLRWVWLLAAIVFAGLAAFGCRIVVSSAAPHFTLVTATLARTLIATSAMLAVMSLSQALTAAPPLPTYARQSWTAKLTLVAMTIMIPAAYVDSVSEGIRIDLDKALQARRFGLASQHAQRLTQLHPEAVIQDQPIQSIHADITGQVQRLDATLRRPLSPRATSSERGRRVTVLMQLDRNEEAIRLLIPLTHGPRFQPISLDYLGLCYQRLERYQESLNAYQAAVAHWTSQPEDDRQKSSLASAWKGVGFAARRLNQRSLEEHAYRQLVETSTTAANHMLLAQCYREHQKTELAAQHTTIAAELDPELKTKSESMLSSISTDHFGCWLVPRS